MYDRSHRSRSFWCQWAGIPEGVATFGGTELAQPYDNLKIKSLVFFLTSSTLL